MGLKVEIRMPKKPKGKKKTTTKKPTKKKY